MCFSWCHPPVGLRVKSAPPRLVASASPDVVVAMIKAMVQVLRVDRKMGQDAQNLADGVENEPDLPNDLQQTLAVLEERLLEIGLTIARCTSVQNYLSS